MSAGGSEFWAPDAGVLLSDSFLDTHCLRIRAGGSELVGLDFEPVPNRDVADIAGTLWLDPATAELQRVDFRYVNLPVPHWLMDASPGGYGALPRPPERDLDRDVVAYPDVQTQARPRTL